MLKIVPRVIWNAMLWANAMNERKCCANKIGAYMSLKQRESISTIYTQKTKEKNGEFF